LRITVACSNLKAYIENPVQHLPEDLRCPRNSAHKPCWHGSWKRNVTEDNVYVEEIKLHRAYCQDCNETISFWPEFIIPYQQQLVEIQESVLVASLSGISVSEISRQIGYDPRTVSRWINRLMLQSVTLLNILVPQFLSYLPYSSLPVYCPEPAGAAVLFLTWLRNLAMKLSFSRTNRLIGLCNILSKGRVSLWGAPGPVVIMNFGYAPGPYP
jgi:DNA-binding transcriptional ArsR family regulator